MTRFITGFTAASLFLACSALTAQEETPRTQNRNNQNRNTEDQNTPDRNTQNRTTQNQNTQNRNQQSAAQNSEQMKMYFLGKLLLMNECEIQTSRLAQQRASSPDVKEFARMLEQDHSKLTQKIRAAVPEFDQLIEQKQFQQQSASLPTQESPENPAQPQSSNQEENKLAQNPVRPGQNPAESTEEGETRTTQKATFPANPEWEGKPVYHILKHDCEASKTFLKEILAMLQKEQGQDFDMAFLGLQIAGHTRALAELNAIEASQDRQLQEIVEEAKTGVQKHLEKAKELAQKHEGREEDDTSRPSRTERKNPTQSSPENRNPTQPQRTPTLPRTQPQPE